MPSDFGPRSFARSWEMNGGQLTDQEAVTDSHIDWLSSRPALALVGDHLLMHSDTLEYLVWGAEIDEINAGIQEVLRLRRHRRVVGGLAPPDHPARVPRPVRR